DLNHAQQQIVALTKRLEQSIKSVSNPNQLSEININLLQTARADIEKSIGNKKEGTSMIIDRISNLEKHIEAISATLSPIKGKLAEASPKDEHGLIFVIMPFAKRHIDTYDTIKRAVN